MKQASRTCVCTFYEIQLSFIAAFEEKLTVATHHRKEKTSLPLKMRIAIGRITDFIPTPSPTPSKKLNGPTTFADDKENNYRPTNNNKNTRDRGERNFKEHVTASLPLRNGGDEAHEIGMAKELCEEQGRDGLVPWESESIAGTA